MSNKSSYRGTTSTCGAESAKEDGGRSLLLEFLPPTTPAPPAPPVPPPLPPLLLELPLRELTSSGKYPLGSKNTREKVGEEDGVKVRNRERANDAEDTYVTAASGR